jgi:hypothetical protein
MHHILSTENLYYVNTHPNPFVKYGAKTYSQTDEDGLTLEIVRRLSPFWSNPHYLELGVGDGMECNTLILAALGWKGQWISNQELVVQHPNYTNAFITEENIVKLINVEPTLVSIDLDGNDYHILKAILKKYSPDVIITEYNAMFIPPVEWVMPYHPSYVWQGSNYFGASLQSLVQALPDYKLVVCNACTGANAYFVHKNFSEWFPEVPQSIRDIYVPPRYTVDILYGTHQRAIETVQTILRK